MPPVTPPQAILEQQVQPVASPPLAPESIQPSEAELRTHATGWATHSWIYSVRKPTVADAHVRLHLSQHWLVQKTDCKIPNKCQGSDPAWPALIGEHMVYYLLVITCSTMLCTMLHWKSPYHIIPTPNTQQDNVGNAIPWGSMNITNSWLSGHG